MTRKTSRDRAKQRTIPSTSSFAGQDTRRRPLDSTWTRPLLQSGSRRTEPPPPCTSSPRRSSASSRSCLAQPVSDAFELQTSDRSPRRARPGNDVHDQRVQKLDALEEVLRGCRGISGERHLRLQRAIELFGVRDVADPVNV